MDLWESRFCVINQSNFQSHTIERCRELHGDETRADNCDGPRICRNPSLQGRRVCGTSECEYTVEICAGDGKLAGGRAGRDQKLAVSIGAAGLIDDRMTGRIDRARGAAEPDIDLVLAIIFGRCKQMLFGLTFTGRDLLGQWRTIIRVLRFRAQEQNRAFGALVP